MALIQTEASHFQRDTSNMAVISSNVKGYEIFKRKKTLEEKKNSEISDLKNQVEELKNLISSLITSSSSSTDNNS